MKNKFLLSILIILFILVLFLLVSNCSKGTHEYFDLVPGNAIGVFHFNYRAFTRTELYKHFLQMWEPFKEEEGLMKNAQAFLKIAGISLERELLNFTVIISNQDAENPDLVIIFRGIYSRDKLNEAIASKNRGFKKFSYRNTPIILYTSSPGDVENRYFCFLDPRTIVVGDIILMKEIIDIKTGREKRTGMNPRMADMIDQIDRRSVLSGALDLSKMKTKVPDRLKQ